MMNKKLILCGLTMTLALTAGAIAFSTANEEVVQFQHVAANAQTLTLNSSNKPTLSAGLGSLEYNEFVHLTYTNASQADGDNHVVLSEGGKIRKTEASNGLSSITVNFAGALMVETSFADSFGGVNAVALTSGSAQSISGNYWRLIATADTTITSITVNYGCDTPTQGYNVSEASLRNNNGACYGDFRIAFAGYTEEEFCALTWSYDAQNNWHYNNNDSWNYHGSNDNIGNNFVIVDNVATFSVNLSDLEAGHGYHIHFGEGSGDPNFKPKYFENSSVVVGNKVYSLKCNVGSSENLEFWGLVYIQVDNFVTPLNDVEDVRLESYDEKPCYVLCGTYFEDHFEESAFSVYDGENVSIPCVRKLTKENNKFELYFDMSGLEAGVRLWPHLKVNDVAWNGTNGNISHANYYDNYPFTNGTLNYNSKTFTILAGWNMPTISVSNS